MKRLAALKRETNSVSRRGLLRGLAGVAATMGVGLLFVGCGGGGGGGLVGDPGSLVFGANAVRVSIADGSTSPIRLGRPYVRRSSSGQVLEIGFELEDGALAALPPSPYNVPLVFRADLPDEAKATTPFRQIGLSYWTGHDPPGIGEVPHFHAVFLFQDVKPFDPTFPELRPVAASEVAPGFIDGRDVPTAVVPGVGNGFEDPTFPHMNPNWYGLTYNYFYYNAHLNGIGTGATTDFLKTTQSQHMDLKLPSVLPKAGNYPHKLDVVYNAQRKSHFFVFSDFQAATNVLP